MFPKKLQKKIENRKQSSALRGLYSFSNLIDFSSNDYLGFSKSQSIFDATHEFLVSKNSRLNGATGSRLLTGNHKFYDEVEDYLKTFHQSETALIFNSGYDANIGFFSCIAQRGDLILYDEYIHASIRDGIQLSNAKAYKFKHNNFTDLEEKITHLTKQHNINNSNSAQIYVVTESVFSMDGDSPDLLQISNICKKHNAYFIVDEAHAVGVFDGGLIQKLHLQNEVFARIITFGKALGCHGAVILGSENLKEYLINFSRSFIYTTGLPPHSVVTIKKSYEHLASLGGIKNSKKLQQNITFFKEKVKQLNLNFIESNSAIHCCIISGNEKTKTIAKKLQENGFDVKPILSPTIATGKERLRFCLHSYNSTEQITKVLENLATFVA